MRQVSQIKLPLVAFALLLFFLSTHGVAADNDGVGGKQALRVYVFGVIS